MMMVPTTGTLEFGESQENAAEQTFRVIEFGGQLVPDEGLVLVQPSGESLLVWPDGKYVFTQSEDSTGQPVIIYYSYVLEDAEGNMVSGTFSPGEALSLARVDHEPQGWSLEDILALSDAVLSVDEDGMRIHVSESDDLDLWSDADSQEHPFFSAVHQSTDQEQSSDMLGILEQGGTDFSEDVLAKMLVSSSEG